MFFLFFEISKSYEIKVIDAETSQPLISATAKITCLSGDCKDSSVFKRTDKNGIFFNNFNNTSKVKITYIGYHTFEATLEPGKNTTILMKPVPVLMNEVVTTGQYVPTTIQKSVFPVKVISDEKITSGSFTNLRELLINELNVKLGQDNVLGSNLTINGLSGQNVKILIDGVPVVGRLNGNIDISQINLNNAQRVEVVEGPMSVIYGTDALGGVINIITKITDENSFNGIINTYFESVGKANIDANLFLNYHDYSFIFSGGRYFFGGFSPNETQRFKLWKPKEQYFADLSIIKSFDEIKLRYSGKYFNEYILNRGEPLLPYKERAYDDKYFTDRLSNALFLDGKLLKNQYINATLSYSNFKRQKNTYIKDLVTLNEKPTAEPSDHDTNSYNSWLFRLAYSRDALFTDLSYQAGIDITIDDAGGKRIESVEKNIGDYAAFISIQYNPFSNLILQPGLRVIYNTKYSAPLIPSFNIKTEITNNLILRGSYAKGFRAPSLMELYFNFVDIFHDIKGKSDLKAEKSNSYNLSLSWFLQDPSFIFKIEPKLFYNDISDLINLTLIEGNQYTYLNIGKYKTLGGNIFLSYIRENLYFSTGFSYTGKFNKLFDSGKTPQFSYSPEYQADLIYDLNFLNSKISILYKYTGKEPGFAVNKKNNQIEEYFIDGYHNLDISFTSIIKIDMPSFNSIKFNLGAKNLFNVVNINKSIETVEGFHNEGSSNLPVAWGRTVFLSVSFDFGKN